MSQSEKDVIDVTAEFELDDAPLKPASSSHTSPMPRETDSRRIAQRQKQVDMGKNTIGYQRYVQQIPKKQRKREHPRTPDVRQVCSKRSFDGQVRKWRRALHQWDLPHAEGESTAAKVMISENKSKNEEAQRQGKANLPLNVLDMNRSHKRKERHTFLQALLSPTMDSPAGKRAARMIQTPSPFAENMQKLDPHENQENWNRSIQAPKQVASALWTCNQQDKEMLTGADLMAKWANMKVVKDVKSETLLQEEELIYSDDELEHMEILV